MRPEYKLTEGGLQHQFQQSKAKIQIFGGGFGNGKTTSGVIKALQLAKDYPGSNGLIARSTYPKLNDTIRKEFLKWCPDSWIERKALSVDNIVQLKNGTVINFRYISQQGKSTESSTSNLLSATYDWIVVDQIEDPEISEKDFNDLMGRLRGSAPYIGDDPEMPSSGPRWFIVLCNPTRNWVYRKLVKPIHDYKIGLKNADLIVDPATGVPIIELYEGSTYSNRENLPDDFLMGLEATYKGQMRSRYLMGEWGAFEGLVYPQYDPTMHVLHDELIYDYLERLINDGFSPAFFESYDHGIAKPACYLVAFADFAGNVFIIDGIYEKEKTVEWLAVEIKRKRKSLSNLIGSMDGLPDILADPAVFKRVSGNARTVGVSTSGLFAEHGLSMQRANNDIAGGVAKVQSYLTVDSTHTHPISLSKGSPRLFISSELTFIDNEFVDYYWKKDTAGEYEDVPMDRNDHSMDAIKYLLTHRPRIAQFVRPKPKVPPKYMKWREYEAAQNNVRSHRHASR